MIYHLKFRKFESSSSTFPLSLYPSISLFELNRKEMLDQIFSAYGEIISVYLPVDLQHGCKPKGLAFIRYTSARSAERAAEAMNGANLGVGREIIVQVIEQKRYWNQDETVNFGKKKRK